MKGIEAEMHDLHLLKDAEIGALREELQRERNKREAAEREAQLLFEAAQLATKENMELRKRCHAWADDADELIRKARQAELEALEL